MRLLIADKLPQMQVEKLRGVADELQYQPDLTAETLGNHISGVNILVVRGTRVTMDALEKADALELIVRSGAGTENIDLEAASARGIYVTNCPEKNSVAVAELTMGLLLAVDRHIPAQDKALKERKWNKAEFAKADGLKGKCFGLIGLGAVGKEVVKRAKAFDMSVVAWSRSLTDDRAAELGISRAQTIDDLITKCDVVSMHVPLTPETRHLLSAKRISKLKPGTIVLNTARGAVIDNGALADALHNGRVRAGLDVFEGEPAETKGEFANALTDVPNWIGTHHIGGSTHQAQTATADETVRVIETYIRTGNVENCVNFAKETPAQYELVVRHYDKIGVLTRILSDLRQSKINVHEVHNVIFEGARAAVASIELDAVPPQGTLDKMLARKDEVIHVRLVKLQPAIPQRNPSASS
jgi:D-3-phosphoglycerate dehydrogenase